MPSTPPPSCRRGSWRPTGSSNGRPSEAKEALSMVTQSHKWPTQGRTVLVTGGSGGTGSHTARFLARRGAQVLITGREPATGEQAAAAIRRETGQELVRFLQADHAPVGGHQPLGDHIHA